MLDLSIRQEMRHEAQPRVSSVPFFSACLITSVLESICANAGVSQDGYSGGRPNKTVQLNCAA